MDPVTAVNAFSAVLTIATEFTRISIRLHRCFKNLKHAQEDVSAICDEVETFSNLLSWFYRTVTAACLADEELATEFNSFKIAKLIAKSGKTALKKIKNILKEVEPLRTDRTYTRVARWIALWKWSMHKETWIPIQISLDGIKKSASMLMTMMMFKDFVQKRDRLQASNTAIPEEMQQQLSASHFHQLLSRLRMLIATLQISPCESI